MVKWWTVTLHTHTHTLVLFLGTLRHCAPGLSFRSDMRPRQRRSGASDARDALLLVSAPRSSRWQQPCFHRHRPNTRRARCPSSNWAFRKHSLSNRSLFSLSLVLANVKELLFLILPVMLAQFHEPSLFHPFSVTRIQNCEFSSVFVQISNKMKWNCNFYSPFSLPAVAFKKIICFIFLDFNETFPPLHNKID